jgi:hypothetical protein
MDHGKYFANGEIAIYLKIVIKFRLDLSWKEMLRKISGERKEILDASGNCLMRMLII